VHANTDEGDRQEETQEAASLVAPTDYQAAVPLAAAEHSARPAAAEDVATQPTPAEQRPAQDDIAHLERQATQRQNAELPARIVHAFLDDLPTTDDQAASIVNEILEDEDRLSDDTLKAIAEVFECAFIWYTDPQRRTEFVHRDTLGYVRAWQELASFRSVVGKTEYFDGTLLPPAERQTVFQAYLSYFASTGLRPGQAASRMKSYAEAHLREIAANRMIAFLIWEVGVPRIAPAAEQRDTHLQEGAPAAEQRADTLEGNAIAILEWLDGAARSILRYKQTLKHKEARRRAGSRRGVAGITPAEQTQRAELRRAKANVRKGRRLAERWSWHAITFKTISCSDWRLLQNHWDGSDVRHLREIQRQRGDRRITMPTLCDADVPPCTLRGSDLAHWQ